MKEMKNHSGKKILSAGQAAVGQQGRGNIEPAASERRRLPKGQFPQIKDHEPVTHGEASIKYKAIKYIRLSVADDSPGESDSIANQRRIIDEFLKKHPEIEVVGEKIDDGYSGILFDRPAFNEMMEEFKEGKANCCVTKDLSRFGREYIETGRYLRYIFPALGVRFIAINDGVMKRHIFRFYKTPTNL